MLASERSLPPNQIGRPRKRSLHHDPISVALADRNLVNADHLRTRPARSRKLGLHVLLVEGLDRMPVQPQIRRHVLDRRSSAAPADVIGKALGVVRIVRQKVEPRSRFTLPQLRQSSRRTSNSRKIRVSPHDRSRTRQTLRSYQPICMRPQQPHAV